MSNFNKALNFGGISFSICLLNACSLVICADYVLFSANLTTLTSRLGYGVRVKA